MSNQAARLKEIIKEKKKKVNPAASLQNSARTIAVASGKGGVGKSTFTINFAYHLSRLDRKVLVVDSDIGMANLDIMLGVKPKYDIGHLLREECSLEDALIEGPEGINLLSGITGDDTFINIGSQAMQKLMNIGGQLEDEFDFLLIDLGAGAAQNIVNTILAAEELVLVLTSEPTSIMDSYSLIKILAKHNYHRPIKLLINQIDDKKEAEKMTGRMVKTVAKYLDIDLEILGIIPYDRRMSTAVHKQKIFSELYSDRAAAEEIEKIAYKITGEEKKSPGIKSYFYKMLGFFNKDT